MMMKKLIATFALITTTTVATDAYAGLVIRFKNGTVLCIGSKSFCKEMLASAQVPGYGENLLVNISGQEFRATGVALSNIRGDYGVVTVEQDGRVIFEKTVYLPDAVLTDVDTGHFNVLSDFAAMDACDN
jgi:hypothetical protein